MPLRSRAWTPGVHYVGEARGAGGNRVASSVIEATLVQAQGELLRLQMATDAAWLGFVVR
jgi:hypothetical protein